MEDVTGAGVMGSRVFIGVGSNLGNRRAYYQKALDLMADLPRTTVVRCSSLYETEPIGEAKNWYVNGVVELETALSPQQLLSHLQKIESALGRKRTKKWAARTIDLDILFFDKQIVHEEQLQIPHSEMHRRRFVLVPLSELAPQCVHPLLGLTVAELLAGLADDKQVRRFPLSTNG